LVLLSDCLNGVAPRNASYLSVLSRTEFVPVRSHMQYTFGVAPNDITCLDIGRYQLHGEYSGIEVINRRLTEMWLKAKNVPVDHDVWADLEPLMRKWHLPATHTNWMTLTLQTSFRCWVGLHEEVVSMGTSGKLLELRRQYLDGSISAVDRARVQLVNQYTQTTLCSRLSPPPQFIFLRDVQEPRTLSLRTFEAW
jgi:hypothetical protein